MNRDFNDFNFFFPDELEEFDPYLTEGETDPEEETPVAADAPKKPAPYSDPDLPAEERIEKLMAGMNATSRTLRSLIAFCETPQAVDAVNERTDEIQGDNHSVYSAATLCRLLEESGAIMRIDAEGNPIDPQIGKPDVVVIDGVEYLQPASSGPSFWQSTPEGMAFIASYDPKASFNDLFEEQPQYLPIFTRVLSMCSAEGGSTSKALSEAIDKDPIVQEPRRYAGYFIDQLETRNGIEWKDGSWRTTELGASILS